VTPVVDKTLEVGVVVLFVGLLTTVLFAGVVPDYRTAAGSAVADRTLAAATERVQAAIPPEARSVAVRLRVDLPRTISGEAYTLRADGRALVLEHPTRGIGGRARLALPGSVARVQGAWNSREPAAVAVESTGSGLVVRLEEG
jgi:hypothetical protein